MADVGSLTVSKEDLQVVLYEQSKELERAAETIEDLNGWKEGLEETVDR